MINFIKSIFTKNPSAKIRKTLDQKYKTSVELQRNGKLREYAEVMKDIVFAEAPVSSEKAEEMILSLKGKDIFLGARGKPPMNLNSLKNLIVNLSNFIAANDDIIDQVEMNPILVKENEVVALDALIIKK